MHEKLKFSFGHIIAFLALLFIGYVIFMSVTYYTRGGYVIGGIVAIGIMILLLLLLYRLQVLKSANQEIEKWIIHERIVLVVFTIVCGVSFVVFSHFWTVKSKDGIIMGNISQSMQASRQIFRDYQKYSDDRISSYCPESVDSLSFRVLKEGLELQLFPPQYVQLKADVDDWLDHSEKYISIWNVFLVGNIDDICRSMSSWHTTLNALSIHKMNDENDSVKEYSKKELLYTSIGQLNDAKTLYATMDFPNPIAWTVGVLCFAMLYLPWLIQRRSPKSMVTIWGRRKIKYKSSNTDILNPGTIIRMKKKGTALDEEPNIQTIHRTQILRENEKSKTSGRRSMTLQKPSKSDE